ncbi:flagellar protein FlgN [Pseudomonas panipatensis]|jgi:flagella synthesis protein FlgN|uniref:Flagella synthesis protein FlgN n=1 Tax=Pseudomonas panipatensis TaxID=428992 RepID=A0A1G8FQ30_9PSED|nr:flagellar protein FlgN [Pseudomonas panipatensis]SDH84220.1 flagella synthesis protein FlgN [Pseudomonas panipatensis]SMP52679.1 flagella synthesis protein FlgN [Pseudomonas panipatensis]
MSERRARLLQLVESDIRLDRVDYVYLRGSLLDLHEQLMARDSDAIARSNQRIVELVDGLRQRAERRGKVLQAFALENDRGGMQRLLQGFPGASREALQRDWQALAGQVEECRQLNERNGRLLAMQSEILDQLLAEQAGHGVYTPEY